MLRKEGKTVAAAAPARHVRLVHVRDRRAVAAVKVQRHRAEDFGQAGMGGPGIHAKPSELYNFFFLLNVYHATRHTGHSYTARHLPGMRLTEVIRRPGKPHRIQSAASLRSDSGSVWSVEISARGIRELLARARLPTP